MLELSHPVIIKPSRGTVLKWQISLCFIYPAVSTPLHGECVSIGTWCYFELHVLCDALDDPACFLLIFSVQLPLLSSVILYRSRKSKREKKSLEMKSIGPFNHRLRFQNFIWRISEPALALSAWHRCSSGCLFIIVCKRLQLQFPTATMLFLSHECVHCICILICIGWNIAAVTSSENVNVCWETASQCVSKRLQSRWKSV